MNRLINLFIVLILFLNLGYAHAQKPGSGVLDVDGKYYRTVLVGKIEWNGGDVIYVGEFNNDGKRSGFGSLISGETIVLYDDYPHEYQGNIDWKIEGFDEFYNFISILGE